MTNKNVLLLCVISALISASVTKYYFPKVNTKIEEVTKEVTKNNIQTVIKTVTNPNGTTESTTTITDRTQIRVTDERVTQISITKDWLVSISASTGLQELTPIYGLQVNRRILGPAYIGALLNTKGELGLSIGLEF